MVSLNALMILAALLVVKHFIADGPLQTDYQVRHKGVWGHPGGLLHAGAHVGLSAVCFALWGALVDPPVSVSFVLFLLAGEFVVHYLIDYSKCRIDSKFGWSSRGGDDAYVTVHDKAFFFSFLADQALHQLTYVAMIYAIGAV